VAVLIALVRRHRRAVSAVVRRAVDDEVPGAVEELELELVQSHMAQKPMLRGEVAEENLIIHCTYCMYFRPLLPTTLMNPPVFLLMDE